MSSSEHVELTGLVILQSARNLHETGRLISDRLLGGVPFSGEIPGLRDEVPALVLTREVLGLTMVLHGGEYEGGHRLTLEIHGADSERVPSGVEPALIDVGQWAAQLISRVEGIQVVTHSSFRRMDS